MDKKQKMGEDGAIAGICGGYIRTEWQLIRSYCGPRTFASLPLDSQKSAEAKEGDLSQSEEWSEIEIDGYQ